VKKQTTIVLCLTMALFLSACVNPSSVKITLIGYIQYNDEFGWVVPCQFIWDGLHGRKERPLWYFGIDGSVKYGVEILGDDEKNLYRPSRAK